MLLLVSDDVETAIAKTTATSAARVKSRRRGTRLSGPGLLYPVYSGLLLLFFSKGE